MMNDSSCKGFEGGGLEAHNLQEINCAGVFDGG